MEIVIRGVTPKSYNSRKKDAYQNQIQSAVKRKYRGKVPCFTADSELYARVYYFTSKGVTVDADNISKPVWDALNGLLYVDDKNIVMRTAAVIDIKKHPISKIDTKDMDSSVVVDLIQNLTEDEVQCMYIECGKFSESMIKFGGTTL